MTVYYTSAARLADAQGLKLWHSRHGQNTRWILCRADWVDHKEYLVFTHLRDVHNILQIPVQERQSV